MKLFDGVGREHEEFKLRLNKDRDIEIAAINAQTDIAREQSELSAQPSRRPASTSSAARPSSSTRSSTRSKPARASTAG